MPPNALGTLDRPVQFFTGKGGVGKSSMIAAVARRAAERGQRPLIVELGTRASSAHSEVEHRGEYVPLEVHPGVYASRVLFEPALIDYVASRLKLRAVARMVSKNASLRRLFVAAPGVDEIVTLHRVAELAASGDWDPVLVDLESSGSAVMFFDLPQVLDTFLEDGPLRQVVDNATLLLRDVERAAVHIVTAPEPFVVRETIDLYRRLRDRDDVHLGGLFINRVPLMWLDVHERERVREVWGRLSEEDRMRSPLRIVVRLIATSERASRCVDGLLHDIALPTTLVALHDPGKNDVVESILRELAIEEER